MQKVNYVSHLDAKMGRNRRANAGPDTQSYGVASMPIHKEKEPKNNHKTNHTKNQPTKTNQEKHKTGKGHIDPAGTVERMMSCASSDGLV